MDPKDPCQEQGAKEPEKMCVSGVEKQKPTIPKDNKAKGWFLTYPQCPCPPQDCLDDLSDGIAEKKGLKIEEYLICREMHKDGNPHLHAFIKLSERIRFSPRLFDIIYEGKTYHGEYQIAKSWHAVQRYVKKDGDFITNINYEAAIQKKSKKIGIKELETDALNLLEDGTISGFQLKSFRINQLEYRLLKQKREMKEKIEIMLNQNKKRHEWIYGPSNSGKTYGLYKKMAENPDNWFQIPVNNDWAGYNGEKNLWIDEYKGQLTLQDLNRICDGGAKVNVKGGTCMLAIDVVVHVLSNMNIKECYKNMKENMLETLYNRFNEKMAYKDGDVYGLIE